MNSGITMGRSGSVFFASYGGGHVAMLAPLAKKLQAEKRPFIFLALTTAAAYLEPLDIPYIGFRHCPEALEPDVQTYGKALASQMPQGTVPIEETIAYLGLNYRELVREHGEQKAQTLYETQGRHAFLPTRLMTRWLNALQPSLVVATNSPRTEQAALTAAGQLNMACICAVDLFALQEVQWIAQPGYANRICVLNESVRQMFLNHGRDAHEVIVTGNPAFDQLHEPGVIEAGARLKKERAWADDKINILWASQPEPAQHPFTDRQGDPTLPRRIEAYLRGFVAKHPHFRLIVRYHPSETQIFQEGQPGVALSPTHENLAALLHAVDFVVVTASTVGLQASLVGKTVLSVDCSVFTADAPYSKIGVSIGVAHEHELGEKLHTLVQSKRSITSSEAQQPSWVSAAEKLLSVMHNLLSAKR
jgi:hypothetical protein